MLLREYNVQNSEASYPINASWKPLRLFAETSVKFAGLKKGDFIFPWRNVHFLANHIVRRVLFYSTISDGNRRIYDK